jgi:hypothetical protein
MAHIFLFKKSQFWYILECPVRWKNLVNFVVIWHILWSFGIFYGHLAYVIVIWYILWSFGIFYGHLAYFTVIWHML